MSKLIKQLTRRRLLDTAGELSAGLLIPWSGPNCKALANSPNMRPRFALIGCGGKLTDWEAHHVDIAMLGTATAGQCNDPVSVEGTAEHNVEFDEGIPRQPNRYNTARAFDLNVQFAGSAVVMNIRNDVDNGILFEGERGRIFVNRGKRQEDVTRGHLDDKQWGEGS